MREYRKFFVPNDWEETQLFEELTTSFSVSHSHSSDNSLTLGSSDL
jgi:hypothetical protein